MNIINLRMCPNSTIDIYDSTVLIFVIRTISIIQTPVAKGVRLIEVRLYALIVHTIVLYYCNTMVCTILMRILLLIRKLKNLMQTEVVLLCS